VNKKSPAWEEAGLLLKQKIYLPPAHGLIVGENFLQQHIVIRVVYIQLKLVCIPVSVEDRDEFFYVFVGFGTVHL
jgi:hypothetical protein